MSVHTAEPGHRFPVGRGPLLIGLLAFVALASLVVLAWIAVQVESDRAAISAAEVQTAAQRDALGTDVDALREQVQGLGEVPVAPPADTTVETIPGPTGAPGASGATGPTGTPGQDGTDGASGASGASGAPGAAATGAVGATSRPGVDGTGVSGASGANGVDGASGAQGPPGVDGQDGDDGIDGQDGGQGPAGRSITDAQCVDTDDGSSQWLISYSDGTTSTTDGPCRVVGLFAP